MDHPSIPSSHREFGMRRGGEPPLDPLLAPRIQDEEGRLTTPRSPPRQVNSSGGGEGFG